MLLLFDSCAPAGIALFFVAEIFRNMLILEVRSTPSYCIFVFIVFFCQFVSCAMKVVVALDWGQSLFFVIIMYKGSRARCFLSLDNVRGIVIPSTITYANYSTTYRPLEQLSFLDRGWMPTTPL